MQRNASSSSLSTILLVLANTLVPIAILIFATGFFPYKPFLPGLAQYADLGYGPPAAAPFGRLVFMVVDALRSDFVFGSDSGFQFTQRLIANGVAMPFTAHATSPTITMPRIKAITTGSIPSFLDVILNFDEGDTTSTLAAQDTWLAQMKAKKTGKLVMYGDDTWLKLFPETFDRADGTSSFFVSDFTEVDNNVTRNVAGELRQDDWNTMILHYLGLDHIGHKAGPRSPNMLPKQREMDGIVKQIYTAMEAEPHLQSTLLVLAGDHGMNDAGNHGASSAGETSPALVFISPKLKQISKPAVVPAPFSEDFRYYSMVEQSDLAPTLGALLGFPVPKNNLGAFIPEFLPFWSEKTDQINLLMHNARQIQGIIAAAFGSSLFATEWGHLLDCSKATSDAEELACTWQSIERDAPSVRADSADGGAWNQRASQWLNDAQQMMSGMASNYDMSRLGLGGGIAATAIILALVATFISTDAVTMSATPLVLITLLYGIMMFASSYVEEEHHFWYWSTTIWVLYLALKGMPKTAAKPLTLIITTLTAVRLIRGWNQTGQKFAGEPDIVKIVMAPNPQLLWSLIFATYAMVGYELFTGLPSFSRLPVSLGLIGTAVSFKLAFTHQDAPELVVDFAKALEQLLAGPSLVLRARVVFGGLALALLYPLYALRWDAKFLSRPRAMRLLLHLYSLLALTQSRATNIPLFLFFQIIHRFLERLELKPVEITTSSILLQMASFFAMGGTNAISSVDLSNAYNGVSGFNVVGVGVLTFISNWAAPVWWTFSTTVLLLQSEWCAQDETALKDSKEKKESKGANVYNQHVALLTVFVATSLGFVMAACTALRTHLFIWTVFSPKYLYSMAWCLGQHLGINVGLGGLLYWLGHKKA